MDLKLTDYDLDLTNGDLSFVDGRIAIAQDVTMALRTFLGETVYDQGAGVPYLQIIFRGKDPNLTSIRFILEQKILSRPGVLGVALETLALDVNTRELSVGGNIETTDGEINFSEILGATP